MLSISILFFIVTGIQFWFSDYMKVALKVPAESVDTWFAFITISAPVLGVIIGGLIVNFFGGYENPITIGICFIEVVLAALCGIPIPFFTHFYLFITFLWFQLFFGGMLLPPMTGIMIMHADN
jgi:MFS transporter, Spinster family, sphingosine-1-phosphate transporter